jgi:apolipoprotein N-acyltransferase
MLTDEENLARFLEAVQRLAKENAVYLAISCSVLPRKGKGENRCVLINDKGQIEINYLKHNLAVGESYFMKKGPAGLSAVNTPYGRIGITICRDLEFPAYVREAGRKKVDIVLSPSFDFPKGITPSNTYNQMLRAVENGFSLVRAVSNGLSIAVDYHGRVLSAMNYFTASNAIMYADVPRKGIRTAYSTIGDVLPWLCTTGFFLFVAFSIVSARRTRK